jgi:hypothetical protein
VLVHGLPHFCQKLSGLLQCEGWEVRYHSQQTAAGMAALANDLRRCDLAYTWGGRISMGKFLWAARCLGKENLVMLWSGSDIMYAREQYSAGKMEAWISRKVHWAVSPWLAEEVRSLGLRCEWVQASFVEPAPEVAPLPEKFSVLVYVPDQAKSKLYGWDQILEVARALSSVEFNLVGLQQGETLQAPPNVKMHGWARDLTPYLQRATVLWRPVEHDGLSFMVLEALAQGRHVLYSYPFRGCVEAKTVAEAKRELKRLQDLHEAKVLSVNELGLRTVVNHFSPQKVRGELLRRWEEIILRSQDESPSSSTTQGSKNSAQQLSL